MLMHMYRVLSELSFRGQHDRLCSWLSTTTLVNCNRYIINNKYEATMTKNVYFFTPKQLPSALTQKL